MLIGYPGLFFLNQEGIVPSATGGGNTKSKAKSKPSPKRKRIGGLLGGLHLSLDAPTPVPLGFLGGFQGRGGLWNLWI